MRLVILVLMLVLAGCQANLPAIPETVMVPVPVSCLDAPIKRPDFVTDAELKKMDSYHAMFALWLDRHLRWLYEQQLEAAMAGCWQPRAGGA